MRSSLVLALLLVSCASVAKLDPAARNVTVAKDAPSGCRTIGDVSGKSDADDQEEAMMGARNDIKNKAHAMGANYVVLDTSSSNQVMGTFKKHGIEILLVGRALQCSSGASEKVAAPAPAPAPAGD